MRAAARALARHDESGLAKIEDVVATDDGLFAVTAFVAGEPLHQIVRASRAPLPKLVATGVVRDLARLLEGARGHAGGRLSFGSLCSDSVLVTYEGEVVLLDLRMKLNPKAEPPYPEIYALGRLLWELLTGRKMEGSPIPPPRAGSDLDRIVMRAVAASTRDRYDDFVVFAEDLNDYLKSRSMRLDPKAEIRQMVQQHFSHKASAMRALTERWRSQARVTPPIRASSFREAALAEPMPARSASLVEEGAPTDDLAPQPLPVPRRRSGLRLALLLLIFAAAVGAVGLVLANGEGPVLVRAWRTTLQLVVGPVSER